MAGWRSAELGCGTRGIIDLLSRHVGSSGHVVGLNQEEIMTFIFSTHDQRVIDRAKRIITLEDGKVLTDITV